MDPETVKQYVKTQTCDLDHNVVRTVLKLQEMDLRMRHGSNFGVAMVCPKCDGKLE